jgi:hypothetical protein
MARKATDFVQFKLRIREGLRRKIERSAEKKKISANAEAVELLEAAFENEEHIGELQQLEQRIKDMQQTLNQIAGTIFVSQPVGSVGQVPSQPGMIATEMDRTDEEGQQ